MLTFLTFIIAQHKGLGNYFTVARPICDKNHRLALYQRTVTMYYIRSMQNGGCISLFCGMTQLVIFVRFLLSTASLVSVYNKGTYSVNSLIHEYLCNCWSDSHRVFVFAFGSLKFTEPFKDRKYSFREICLEVSSQNKCLHCNKQY